MTSPDAGASPKLPGSPNIPGGMRSIYERMTNPTPADLQVNERIRNLSRAELGRIMDHFGATMEHLATQRDDVVVKRNQDAMGWTIRVELKPNVESPVQAGG